MGLFDIFKKHSAAQSNPKTPRKHHYTFAYKALPGLAFADPHVPLSFSSVTYSWKDLQDLIASGDPFDRETPNRKLASLWAYTGAKLPNHERLSDSGLSAIGGEFGDGNAFVLVRLPEPMRDTEAYFIVLIYPKSWFDDPNSHERNSLTVSCYLLAKSSVPGSSGSGASLRILRRDGHGVVNFGVDPSLRSFLHEVQSELRGPERWITWVESPTWNFFMQDTETGQTFGSQ
jgi:hypothetical protein